MVDRPAAPTRGDAKERLLNAAVSVIRTKGFAATSVDDLCKAAGVTKGAFFHHFPSKDDLAIAAANHWSEVTGALFADAPYHLPEDPLDRILAYIDFRAELIQGGLPDFTCLVGTMLQETYNSHPHIREACANSITGHAATIEPYFAAAMQHYTPSASTNPRSLALHTQAVLQGAFILAKATNDPESARDSVRHLRAYITSLFVPTKTGRKRHGAVRKPADRRKRPVASSHL